MIDATLDLCYNEPGSSLRVRGSERPERTFGQSDSLDAIGSCVLTWSSLVVVVLEPTNFLRKKRSDNQPRRDGAFRQHAGAAEVFSHRRAST